MRHSSTTKVNRREVQESDWATYLVYDSGLPAQDPRKVARDDVGEVMRRHRAELKKAFKLTQDA